MKLILQKDVKNLGKTGEQVVVKKGYARNFLIPNKLALPVNKGRLKAWKHQNILIEAKKRKALLGRKNLIEKLASLNIEFEKESLKDGKLFGSVTAFEISQTLEKQYHINVDKKDISPMILKTAGEHTITVCLDSEHKTEITIKIKGKITKKREKKPKDKPLNEEPDSSMTEDLLLTEVSETQTNSETEARSAESPENENKKEEKPATSSETPKKSSKKTTEEKPSEDNVSKNLKNSEKEIEKKKEETPEDISKTLSEKEDTPEVKTEESSSKLQENSETKEETSENKEEAGEETTKPKKKKKFIFF